MHCPCCGAELGLIEMIHSPIPKDESVIPCILHHSDSSEVHSSLQTRWAVRKIKESREELYFREAKVVWAFSQKGLVVQTTVGQYRVRVWSDVRNRAGRSVLLDVWG